MVTPTSSSSSNGAASIDVAAVVKELMSVENKPLEAISARIATNSLVISDLGTVKTKLATFSTALDAFESADSYNTTVGSSSDTSVLTATSSSGAQKGNYSVTVTTLAAPQRYMYAGFTSEDAEITLGDDFAITIGSTTYSNSTITNSITSTPTISELAEYINSLGEDISASVVAQDNTGGSQTYVLTIQSTETGTDNAVSLGDVVDAATLLLSDDAFTLYTTDAEDAQFDLNGVTYKRSSNTISDVIDGLAMELVDTGTSIVKVSQGTNSSETIINTLITTYNDLIASYKSMTANSSNSDTPGSFANNPTMLSFINEIKTKFATGVSYGTDYAESFSLSYIGIDMQIDGTLEFNQDSYDDAITAGLQTTLAGGVTVGLSEYGYEEAKVTFRALSEGETFILGGLTFTAGSGGSTASQAASAFANGTTGRSSGELVSSTVSGGSISGTVTNWDIGSYSTSGSSVVFTSTSAGNVDNLENTGSGSTNIYISNDSLSSFVADYAGDNGYLTNLVTNQTEVGYDLSDRQDQIQNRLNGIQNNYINQYSALNALLFQLSSTSSSLASVLDSLNSNNN
jgi:flagellar hook-associated protein 2